MCREGAGFVAACGGENIFHSKQVLSEVLRPVTAHSQGEKYFLRRTGRHKK